MPIVTGWLILYVVLGAGALDADRHARLRATLVGTPQRRDDEDG